MQLPASARSGGPLLHRIRPLPYASSHRRTVCRSGGQRGTQTPGYTCRIRRVTMQDEICGHPAPELGDMNAVIMVGRPSWRARIFGICAVCDTWKPCGKWTASP